MFGRKERDHVTRAPRNCTVSVLGATSYHRLPAQQHLGLADVRSPPLGVVLGLGQELDLTVAHCVHVKTDSQALIQGEKRVEIDPQLYNCRQNPTNLEERRQPEGRERLVSAAL